MIHLLANEWAPASGIHFLGDFRQPELFCLCFLQPQCMQIAQDNESGLHNKFRTDYMSDIYRAGEDVMRMAEDEKILSPPRALLQIILHLSLLKIEKELLREQGI